MLNRLRFWHKKVHNADIAALPVNFSICAVMSKRQLYNSVEVGMKLIFCIDEKKGMMFFGKRQSQDSVLREWIVNHTAGSKLWMSNYSAKQFKNLTGYIADDDYVEKATVGDYCFIEDKGYSLEKVSEIILCQWNRRYQSDRVFDIDLKANGFKKATIEDIKGSSHDKITIETYRKG